MLVLGLQGSPRKNGNTNYLLNLVLEAAAELGAETKPVQVPRKNIKPCIGCTNCERKGLCAIDDDDMTAEMYPLLRRADLVILATPIYFYNATAQMKMLIDRSQTLWARKYKLGLVDPGRPSRKGMMLSVGATKGKNLFEGMALTAKYFFDAVGASFESRLTYWRIEAPGDIKKHAAVADDVKMAIHGLAPIFSRKKILFVCRENACRSQMAAAFARYMAGDDLDVDCAGSRPAGEVNPLMQEVMAELGYDMAFCLPRSIEAAVGASRPHMIVTMGCAEECPYIPAAEMLDWELEDPGRESMDVMRRVRDEIQARVEALISRIGSK
ncbi:MAG: NAD(P)H-dependent oxidoreductase [Desulfobacterales bacterium]|nr:NAD(P)H-dependent oxidoreductase [Desulfobacterales bacterium]